MAIALGALAAGVIPTLGSGGFRWPSVVTPLFGGGGVSAAVSLVRERELKLGENRKSFVTIGESRGHVVKLSSLSALDSLGGVSSPRASWRTGCFLRFGVDEQALSVAFFWRICSLASPTYWPRASVGCLWLLNTMVYTQLAANALRFSSRSRPVFMWPLP
jgi:hypothetical protein